MNNEEIYISDEDAQAIYDDVWAEQRKMDDANNRLKAEYKEKLGSLVNTKSLYKWLNEDQEHWVPEAIVDIKLTDEKASDYPTYQHARILNDKDHLLYMKCTFDDVVKGIDYYYVWQTTIGEDSYSGYLLFPLNNGQFFKVSYNC